MHKPGPIGVAVFSFLIRFPRALLVVVQSALFVLPFYFAWRIARWYNGLDKAELLQAFRESLRPSDSYTYIVGAIISAGIVFFAFKKYQQFWYGVLETLVAIVGCFITAQIIRDGVYKSPSANVILFQGFTAVYLLVRGLSNIDDGRKKPFFIQTDVKRFRRVYRVYVDLESQYIDAFKEGKPLRGIGDDSEGPQVPPGIE